MNKSNVFARSKLILAQKLTAQPAKVRRIAMIIFASLRTQPLQINVACFFAVGIFASLATANARAMPSDSTWLKKPITQTLMLQALTALRDEGAEKLALSMRTFLSSSADMSTAAFSWRDSRRAPDLNLNLYFPPLAVPAPSLGSASPATLISAALDERSNQRLGIDPHDLGYVDRYSVATFDQVLFVSQSRNRVAAFRAEPLKSVAGIQSVVRFAIGSVNFVLVGGRFSRGDSNVEAFTADLLRDRSQRWVAWPMNRTVLFTGESDAIQFPANLASSDENGRLDNQVFETARLSIAANLAFASIAQLNYYSPGCCWHALSKKRPAVNALLVVYNETNWVTAYVGYGHTDPGP